MHLNDLTKTEREIASYLAGGYTEKDIARKLGKAVNTVRVHTRNIRKKLEASTNTDVCRIYIFSFLKKEVINQIILPVLFLLIQIPAIIGNADIDYRRMTKTGRKPKTESCHTTPT